MWFPIAIQVLTGLIALSALWKDWESYGSISKRFGKRLPIFLAIFIVLAIIFTIKNVLVTAEREANNVGRIEELGNQLKINEDGAERRAKQQLESFQTIINDLNKRLSNLQTKINTDHLLRQNTVLLKEVNDIRVQINETKARIEQPLAQAELVATFNSKPNQPILSSIEVPRQADNSVGFTIYVVNISKVQAKEVSIYLRLCEKCSFVNEPDRFLKGVGAKETDRYMDETHLPAGIAISIPLKIKTPPSSPAVAVAVTPRCDNCIVNPTSKLFISIKN
jgi:hypothetical protein